MKRMIVASTTSQSLEQYVGLPFDLSSRDVQGKIVDYAADKLIATLKNTRGYKRRKFYVDDVSWSADKIYFEVVEEVKDEDPSYYPSWSFNCRLNYYDEPSESYADVENLIDGEIRDFIHYL